LSLNQMLAVTQYSPFTFSGAEYVTLHFSKISNVL
jgi:hypothetical protein